MTEPTRCSACGRELSQEAFPQGLCAECLLKLGLSSTNIPAAEPSADPPREKIYQRSSRSGVIHLLTGAGVVLAIALAAILIYRREQLRPPINPIRIRLQIPGLTDFAASPDGRRLAFTAIAEGKNLLWIHPLDSFRDTPLQDTEDAAHPFWSPDSRFIGFFARGKLRKVDIGTGITTVLSDAPLGEDGAWGSAGTIVFRRDESPSLYRVSAEGGSPEAITGNDPSERASMHRWPNFLPDGRHFIYTSLGSAGKNEGLFIASLDSREVQQLTPGLSAAFADRSLLFVRNGMLFAQPFHPRTLRLAAEPKAVPFAEHVDHFSASGSVLAYREKETTPAPPLAWVDRLGKQLGLIEGLTADGPFAISPTGQAVAASKSGDIWVADLKRGIVSRFTFDRGEDTSPLWSPDGSRIVFLSNRNGQEGLYQKPVNGAESETLLFAAPRWKTIESWSPDGRYIVYTARDEKGKSTVGLLPVEGERKPIPLQSAFNLRQARVSPDGRWLSYVTDENGKDEVYVRPFPTGESKWQVSNDGGSDPRWSRDGRELFYVSRERMLTVVAVNNRGSFLELSTVLPLLRMPRGSYDVLGDRQFLMPSTIGDDPPVAINIVINWADEIQRP